MQAQPLTQALRQFTGTEGYHKLILCQMLATDGIARFCEQAGAYWFADLVAFELLPKQRAEPFISITLSVADSRATITADDGNGKVLYRRAVLFTDCPEGEFKFFLVDGVLMLPSEY